MRVLLTVPPEIVIKAKLETLCELMTALLSGFGGADFEDVLARGVKEQHLLQTVFVVYLNAKDEVVGHFTLRIDWTRFQVEATSDTGELALDASLPLDERITKVHRVMMEEYEKRCQQYGVVAKEVQYAYVKEVEDNPARLNEVRAYLGLSPAKARPGDDLLDNPEISYHSKDSKSLTVQWGFRPTEPWKRMQRWFRHRLTDIQRRSSTTRVR